MKSDSVVKGDVLAELKWDAEIDDTKIGVIVSNGAVTLTGHVPTYRQKMAAAKATMLVSGVLAVVNNIEVRLAAEGRTTDEGLAERIASVLKWNVSIPNKDIKAEVKNGIVTLSGEVDWQYQRANILKNIEHVGGVVSVVDLITLKPRLSESDIEQKIKEALKRHADLEAKNVSVTVSGGTATLSGSVESMPEMNRIEHAVWAAPGVSRVIDNLHIG
jgi:osmotically-inducible protein OsmY